MQEVNCFKGISNDLFVLGLKPGDIAIVFLSAVLLHGIVVSLLVDFIYLVAAYIVIRKMRFRPHKYFLSVIMFFIAPKEVPLPDQKEKNDIYFTGYN